MLSCSSVRLFLAVEDVEAIAEAIASGSGDSSEDQATFASWADSKTCCEKDAYSNGSGLEVKQPTKAKTKKQKGERKTQTHTNHAIRTVGRWLGYVCILGSPENLRFVIFVLGFCLS